MSESGIKNDSMVGPTLAPSLRPWLLSYRKLLAVIFSEILAAGEVRSFVHERGDILDLPGSCQISGTD